MNCCVKIESLKNKFVGFFFYLPASELTHVWGKNEGLFQEMKHLMCLQKCNIPVCWLAETLFNCFRSLKYLELVFSAHSRQVNHSTAFYV